MFSGRAKGPRKHLTSLFKPIRAIEETTRLHHFFPAIGACIYRWYVFKYTVSSKVFRFLGFPRKNGRSYTLNSRSHKFVDVVSSLSKLFLNGGSRFTTSERVMNIRKRKKILPAHWHATAGWLQANDQWGRDRRPRQLPGQLLAEKQLRPPPS